MAAGSLAAGEDDANGELLGFGSILTLLEDDLILAVGVGEQSLDLLLVGNGLGGAAVLDADFADAVSQHAGQLGLIGISCDLQGGQFHMKTLLI